jgi:hypothetical protein
MKQMTLAMHNYHDTYQKLPGAAHCQVNQSPDGMRGHNEGNWMGHILPYIEQGNLFKQAYDPVGGLYWIRSPIRTKVIPLYLCPSDPSFYLNAPENTCLVDKWSPPTLTPTPPGSSLGLNLACSNYMANALVLGNFINSGTLATPQSITSAMPDGTSNTVVIGETYKYPNNGDGVAWGGLYNDGPWIEPIFGPNAADIPVLAANIAWMTPPPSFTASQPWFYRNGIPFQVAPSLLDVRWYTCSTPHQGGMVVGCGDASVRIVSGGISVNTWNLACWPNDGTPLSSDW